MEVMEVRFLLQPDHLQHNQVLEEEVVEELLF